MSGRVQRSQRLGAGVEGFTLAPEWQGWNSWRWGKERDTLGIERKEKGKLKTQGRLLRAKATPERSSPNGISSISQCE